MATPSTVHRDMLDAIADRDVNRLCISHHAEYTYTGPDGKELAGPGACIVVFQTYLAAFPDM